MFKGRIITLGAFDILHTKGARMKRFIFAVVCAALFAPASFGATQKPRIVTIEALVDYRDDAIRAHQAISFARLDASNVFRKEFNVEFKLVAIGTWWPPSSNFDGNEELIRLESVGHDRSDLVIAFTSSSFFADIPEEIDGEVAMVKRTSGGLAKLGGNHAIVRLYDEGVDLILLHEIGHLFRAEHAADSKSVMNGQAIIAKVFDEESKKTVRENRDRKF